MDNVLYWPQWDFYFGVGVGVGVNNTNKSFDDYLFVNLTRFSLDSFLELSLPKSKAVIIIICQENLMPVAKWIKKTNSQQILIFNSSASIDEITYKIKNNIDHSGKALELNALDMEILRKLTKGILKYSDNTLSFSRSNYYRKVNGLVNKIGYSNLRDFANGVMMN